MSTLKELMSCACRLFAVHPQKCLTFCCVSTHRDTLSDPWASTQRLFVNKTQHHAEGERQTGTITFLWKVPSKAATMIVFPKLAISSQNSTVSGNYKNVKKYFVFRFSGRPPGTQMCKDKVSVTHTVPLNQNFSQVHNNTRCVLPGGEMFQPKQYRVHILTNCPSSTPMTQAFSARALTSPRLWAGTASIVLLKDGQDKGEIIGDKCFTHYFLLL